MPTTLHPNYVPTAPGGSRVQHVGKPHDFMAPEPLNLAHFTLWQMATAAFGQAAVRRDFRTRADAIEFANSGRVGPGHYAVRRNDAPPPADNDVPDVIVPKG